MKTLSYEFTDLHITYPLELLGEPSELLFLDIETTGLSPRDSFVYLIGVSCLKDGIWQATQWFAETPEQEPEILAAFLSFVKEFQTLIHFNGNQFDLPFLEARSKLHSLDCDFSHFQGIDLYKRITPCKNFLRLPNCRQKTIEEFLRIQREDTYQGGELISLYADCITRNEDELLRPLLLHNRDDIKGLIAILPILAYPDIFNRPIQVKKVQANYYRDMNQQKRQELLLHLKLATPLPKLVSFHAGDCYLTAQGQEAVLRVPVYNEEMKYFYANYKDYYFLPEENMAIHKSVASFVEREHRIPATAANCYTRKASSYLPQWDYVFEPFYRREYKDPELFFELTDEFKTDRAAFSKYASHVLTMMGQTR